MKRTANFFLLTAFLLSLALSAAEIRLEFQKEHPAQLPAPFGYAVQEDAQHFRLELLPGSYDPKQEFSLTIFGVQNAVNGYDLVQNKVAIPTIAADGILKFTVPENLFALEFSSPPAAIEANFTPVKLEPVPNQQPAIQPPKGKRVPAKTPVFQGQKAILDTGVLRASFAWDSGRLQMLELFSYDLNRQLLLKPTETRLMLIRVKGQNYDIRDAEVLQVSPTERGLQAKLAFQDIHTEADLAIWGTVDGELKMSLEVRNAGQEDAGYITYFPVLENLQLSDNQQDDFYLFPYLGGLISQLPCYRREIYGYNYCFFQFMDIFSPQNGGGLYLRADDATGLYKHFALRKAGNAAGRIKLKNWPLGGRLNMDTIYYNGLEVTQGTSLAIDYVQRDCAPGESFKYPVAALGGHIGDWHQAMDIYSAWAHQVWKWQKGPPKLANVWYLQAGRGTAEPLFSDSINYLDPRSQMAEINGYWTVSEMGSWGVPVDENTRWSFIDPVTGKRVISYNRGDYGNDGYNPQWGGLPALRKFIKDIQATGRILTLYTVPMIAFDTTKLAKEHCPAWNVRNLAWFAPKGHDKPEQPQDKSLVLLYGAYRMCMENPDYQDWVVENLIRLLKDTDADGLRMDEFGIGGYICLSKEHKHWGGYAYNHNGHLQAVSLLMRRLRESFDTFPKSKILMAEFLGHDMMSSSLDGALSWMTATNDYKNNPAPVHLMRFYFPEVKIFEIDEFRPGAGARKDWRYWLWNGLACYNSGGFPADIINILTKHQDAIGSGVPQALVPTLHPMIAANTFTTHDGQKRVWTLLNVSRNTVSTPALTTLPGHNYQAVYAQMPLNIQDGVLSVTMRPNEVVVLVETK